MSDPQSFEAAMSVLVAAIGHIKNNPAETQCQSSRLAEQVSRLDAVWVRQSAAILHKLEPTK